MLERQIEGYACGVAKRRGWWERKFKTPARRSAPDRIFAKNGRVFWVEFKAPGKRPTPLQLLEHKRMRAAGLTVYVCDSKDEFLALIDYEDRQAEHLAL
jgi:hypothetical protein